MKKLITIIALSFVIAFGVFGFSACSSNDEGLSGSISMSGSSALYPLAQKAAENLMDENKNFDISVNAGGSGTGLKDVLAGTVNIGNSDVFASEKLTADEAQKLVDHKVCVIGVAPIVNTQAGVTNLTTQQLIDIFTGVTTNWKDVGGNDVAIILCTRPASSGTRALFTKFALNGTSEVTAANGFESDNSGELLTKVKDTKGAIGYMALSYLTDLTKAGVTKVSINSVQASYANVYNGTYTVWGYEHMYTKGEATGLTKSFIDYMLSDDFGKVINELGYGVSSSLTQAAIDTHK